MKIFTNILLLFFSFISSYGQVATINDPDGWTNVRNEPNSKSEIIHKLYENEVFWYDNETELETEDWISIYIPKNDFSLGLETSEPYYIKGFIHRSRLLPLEKLSKDIDTGFLFNYDLSDFNSTNRITNSSSDKWITEIDGRPVWGTDGNFPKIQIDNVDVKIDNKKIYIHKVFYSDIYECDNDFSIYKNGNTYFVYQRNSDGAGSYELVWVIDSKGLKQRLVGSII